MVERVRSAVVRLRVEGPDGAGTATGVIYDVEDHTGYLVTNEHAVAGAHSVTVTVNDRTEYIGTVHGLDAVFDLAVVSICCGDFQTLQFSDEVDLPAGSAVINVGYALGFSGEATVTRGIVSAVRYDQQKRAHFIQTDAPMNPGNSGGPMLSLDGVVLGINTFKFSGDGLGFAISGRDVLEVLSILQNAAPATPTPTPTSTPTAAPLFGPLSRNVDVNEYSYAFFASGRSVRNAVVDVTFPNVPNVYASALLVRKSVLLAIRSFSGEVALGRWDGTSWQGVEWNATSAIDTASGGLNRVWLTMSGAAALVYINGQYVLSLDLARSQQSGDVSVIRWVDAEVKRVPFDDLTIWRSPRLLHGPDEGEIEHRPEDGLIDDYHVPVRISDGVVEAVFANPYDASVGRWSSGFMLRQQSRGDERFHIILIDSGGYFYHFERQSDGTDLELAREAVTHIKLGTEDKNHILVEMKGASGKVYINGQHAADLALDGLTERGSVAAVGGYFHSDGVKGYVTRFENLTIWP